MGWWKCLVCCWSYFFGPRSVPQAGQGPYRTAAPLPIDPQAEPSVEEEEPSVQPVTMPPWMRPMKMGACVGLGTLAVIGPNQMRPDGPLYPPSATERPRVQCVELAHPPICRIHDPPCFRSRVGNPFLVVPYVPARTPPTSLVCGPINDRGDILLIRLDDAMVCHP